MLKNKEIVLISYTASKTLRNTFISKHLDKGEYYILFERRSAHKTVLSEKKYPALFSDWRDTNISIYGPSECRMKTINVSKISPMHDYLAVEGWTNFANIKQSGTKLVDFDVPFEGGEKHSFSISKINVPM